MLKLLLTLTAAMLSHTVLADTYPLITVDEAHIGFSRTDDSEPPPYLVPAGKGLIVQAATYQIVVPKEFSVPGPNSIHVVYGTDRKYKVAWKGNWRHHELSAATLRPLPGSPAFTGFQKGDTAIIAIGYDHSGITPGKENVLSAMWLGLVKFQ